MENDSANPDDEIDRKSLRALHDRFLALNQQHLEALRSRLPEESRTFVDAVPLLMHSNHAALPGSVDAFRAERKAGATGSVCRRPRRCAGCDADRPRRRKRAAVASAPRASRATRSTDRRFCWPVATRSGGWFRRNSTTPTPPTARG
jgi:hypothetical protein